MQDVLFLLACFIMFDCSQGLKCYRLGYNANGDMDNLVVTCPQPGWERQHCEGVGRGCHTICSDWVRSKCDPDAEDCCCNTDLCNPPPPTGLKCYIDGWNDYKRVDYTAVLCIHGEDKFCQGGGYGCGKCTSVKDKCEAGDGDCCCNTDMCNPPPANGIRCYIGGSNPENPSIDYGAVRWCGSQHAHIQGACESIGFHRACNSPLECDKKHQRGYCDGAESDYCCCTTERCNTPQKPEYSYQCYVGVDKGDLKLKNNCISCLVTEDGWMCGFWEHGNWQRGHCGREELHQTCDMDAGTKDENGKASRCCCKKNLCNKPIPDTTTITLESTTQSQTTVMTRATTQRQSQPTTLTQKTMQTQSLPAVLPQKCTLLAGLLAILMKAFL